MKIAVLSDIHDNVWKLEAALGKLRKLKPEALICCGDLCSPFIVGLLKDKEKGLPGPIHIVFGNNDADLYRITQQAVQDEVIFYGELAELVVQHGRLLPLKGADPAIPGKRIAVNHFNYLARPMAASGKYDVVFYGHNHQHRHERFGQIDVINPGTIMGYNPLADADKKDIASTFLIYDTAGGAEPMWFEVDAAQKVCDYEKVTVEEFKL